MEKYKVVIIGSGIAGMSSAIYLKRGGVDPLIIEASAPGGALNVIPNIENYPGYVNISGPDLAMNIYNQVNDLGIKYYLKKIKKIDLENKVIDDIISFDYLIIATGRRHKLLNLSGEENLIGRGVSTCALCDGAFYKGKEVVVVGGGSSALSESLYLSNICKKVTLVHRKNFFRGEDFLERKVKSASNIDIIYNVNVKKYNVLNNMLTSVTLDNGKVIKADGVFLAIGSLPNSELFEVQKDNGYIVVNDHYETSMKNVYAVGDVIKKDMYQLVTASSDGAKAAFNIIEDIKKED